MHTLEDNMKINVRDTRREVENRIKLVRVSVQRRGFLKMETDLGGFSKRSELFPSMALRLKTSQEFSCIRKLYILASFHPY
jgi:hypothetical protein